LQTSLQLGDIHELHGCFVFLRHRCGDAGGLAGHHPGGLDGEGVEGHSGSAEGDGDEEIVTLAGLRREVVGPMTVVGELVLRQAPLLEILPDGLGHGGIGAQEPEESMRVSAVRFPNRRDQIAGTKSQGQNRRDRLFIQLQVN